ncbi:MAG: hypothetical protein ACYDAG_10990 [Chloroflexota bacterium]
MTTAKQIDANRRNALVSTGPRTAAGKDASSANALSHGLRARQVLLQDEDPAALDQLAEDLHDHFAPAGRFEEVLVERIVAATWRLRRLGRVEAGILDWRFHGKLAARARQQAARLDLAANQPPEEETSCDTEDRPYYEAVAREQAATARRETDTCTLGAAFVDEVAGFSTLSRYEATLDRSLHRALHELQRLQAARNGAFVPPPITVDITPTNPF